MDVYDVVICPEPGKDGHIAVVAVDMNAIEAFLEMIRDAKREWLEFYRGKEND